MTKTINSIYQENGFENRKEYLKDLSNEYSIDIEIVYSLADLLGEEEYFDGLICSLENLI